MTERNNNNNKKLKVLVTDVRWFRSTRKWNRIYWNLWFVHTAHPSIRQSVIMNWKVDEVAVKGPASPPSMTLRRSTGCHCIAFQYIRLYHSFVSHSAGSYPELRCSSCQCDILQYFSDSNQNNVCSKIEYERNSFVWIQLLLPVVTGIPMICFVCLFSQQSIAIVKRKKIYVQFTYLQSILECIVVCRQTEHIRFRPRQQQLQPNARCVCESTCVCVCEWVRCVHEACV